MAVRIQMRRGAATSWNATDPVLAEGEFGFDTTAGQLKIGTGATSWSNLDYLVTDASLGTSLGDYIELIDKGAAEGVAELDSNSNVLTSTGVVFEGETADAYQTTLTVTDPTADRTITIPDVSGNMITSGDTGTVTNTMLAGSIENGKLSNSAITINGTSVSLGGSISIPGDIEGVTAGTGLSGGGTSGTVTLSVDTAVVATNNNTLTMTNKTLTNPIVNGGTFSLGNAIVAIPAATSPSQTAEGQIVWDSNDDVLTIGDGTGRKTLVNTDTTQTLTNKTLTSPSIGTSLTTASTSFDLLNTTATTINLGGAATVLSIGSTSGTTTFNNSVTISGDLTVNGTTTTINSTTLSVDDKNIVLANGNTSDVAADGGGITLKGGSDKTFTWADSNDSWSSSEHISLASGKSYKINGTNISAALPGLTWGEVKNGKSGLTIS